MEAILQANDDIDAVYTHDDDMAEGVVAAIQNAGREDEMFLTGAGGSCAAFDQIEEGGLYAATYLYSPTMAGSAVNMARLIALGEGFSDLVEPEVPSMIVVPPDRGQRRHRRRPPRALLRLTPERAIVAVATGPATAPRGGRAPDAQDGGSRWRRPSERSSSTRASSVRETKPIT